MKMKEIQKNLYQFSTYVPPINLSFKQYLFKSDEALLIHTGSFQGAEKLLEKTKKVLGEQEIKYIFLSHFEADECGALAKILQLYPQAQVLASEISARQLLGFGLLDKVEVKKAGEIMKIVGEEYKFLAYPSEMHLWEGLLLLNLDRKILFSSDLFMTFGDCAEEEQELSLKEALTLIQKENIADEEKRKKLIQDLEAENIAYIASGHGKIYKII